MSIGPVFFPPLGPAKGSSGAFSPRGWNRCVLGGQVVPAFAKLTNGEVILKMDRKTKKGSHGANPTFDGMDPQPIGIELMTYSDEDRESLVGIIGPLVPQPGRTTKPVSIDFPPLRLIGVSSVVVIGVGGLIPIDGKPMQARMSVKMLHWLPAKSGATVTPSGAPVRKPGNARDRRPPPPPPTQQSGVCGPPPNFTPAR